MKRKNGEKKGKVMKKGRRKKESVRGIPAFDIAG